MAVQCHLIIVIGTYTYDKICMTLLLSPKIFQGFFFFICLRHRADIILYTITIYIHITIICRVYKYLFENEFCKINRFVVYIFCFTMQVLLNLEMGIINCIIYSRSYLYEAYIIRFFFKFLFFFLKITCNLEYYNYIQ